jgi:hypothetical protein
MAWKTMDVQEQRVRFVVAATQKVQPFRALCAAYETDGIVGCQVGFTRECDPVLCFVSLLTRTSTATRVLSNPCQKGI